MQRRLWLTTEKEFQDHINDPWPLDARIWVRAHDLRGCRDAVEETENIVRQRTVVRERLRDLRRYSLLPPARTNDS
jgi:hypothetical protein